MMDELFTIHVFLSHDPFIASMLLPDLYSDFPTSKWILPPLREVPVRDKDGQPPEELVQQISFRNTLGRYILPNPISKNTSLESLLITFSKECQINLEKLAHFTIFPQSNTAAIWHDEPLPLELTLSNVAGYDQDAPFEFTKEPRILHLVLETKAAALTRAAGDGFDYSKASVFQIRDHWSAYKSFWHMNLKPRPCGLVSSLMAYRNVKVPPVSTVDKIPDLAALPRLKDQIKSSQGLLAPGQIRSNHMEYQIEMEMYQVSKQVEYLEALAAKKKKSQLLARYAQQWEEWVVKKNYADLRLPGLQSDDIDGTAVGILQQILDESAAWNVSPRHATLQEAVEGEYYASRPWMTAEERAQDKERLLSRAQTAAQS